jgi:hypothetical protein
MHSAISEAVSDAPIVVLGRLILHQVRIRPASSIILLGVTLQPDITSRPLLSLLLHLTFSQIFGLPLYLIMNASGRKEHGHMNHFIPINNKLFKSRDFWDVVVSDVGILSVIATSASSFFVSRSLIPLQTDHSWLFGLLACVQWSTGRTPEVGRRWSRCG